MIRKFVVIVMDKNGKFDCILQGEVFESRELAEKARSSEEQMDSNHGQSHLYSYVVETIWYE